MKFSGFGCFLLWKRGDFRGMKRVVWIGTSTYPFFLPSSDLRLPMSSGLGIVCLSFEILFRVFPENRSAVFTMSASCLNCLKSSSLECKRSWCLFCFFVERISAHEQLNVRFICAPLRGVVGKQEGVGGRVTSQRDYWSMTSEAASRLLLHLPPLSITCVFVSEKGRREANVDVLSCSF